MGWLAYFNRILSSSSSGAAADDDDNKMGWFTCFQVFVKELFFKIRYICRHFSISASTSDLLDLKKKKNQEEEHRDWVDLPDHLLSFIAFKFLYTKDFISFGAVCKTWYSVYTENRFHFLRLPLLMLPTGFYNLIERRFYDFQLPMPLPPHKIFSHDSAYCAGSSHGWLVIVRPGPGESYQVSLINPFLSPLKNEIQLPPLDTFVIEDAHIRPDPVFHPRYIHHAVLSVNPASHPNNYVIMAICGQYCRLAFFRPPSGGKIPCWTYFAPDLFNMTDIIYCKDDQFYAVDHGGSVFNCVFNDQSPRPTISRVAPAPPLPLPAITPCKWYLVKSESSGDLLQILRYVDILEDGVLRDGDILEYEDIRIVGYITTQFDALKLDRRRLEWVKMDDLEGCILFLGANSSMCLRALDFPDFKPNTIYFTDDYQDMHFTQEKHGIGPHDMGVFDFEDCTIKPHYPVEPNAAINPPPMWISWPSN